MIWNRFSLTQRLFALTAVALFPTIAILLVNVYEVRKNLEREVHDLAFRTGQMAHLELEQIVSGIEAVLLSLGRAPVIRTMNDDVCGPYLREVSEALPQITQIGVIDRTGRVRCPEGVANTDRSDRGYFQQAMKTGKFAVGEFTVGRLSGRRTLPMASPIRDATGKVVGVISTGLDLDWLGARLKARSLGDGGAITIADRTGVIIAREPSPEKFVGTRIPQSYIELVGAEGPGTVEVLSQDGVQRVLGYFPATMPPLGLYVSGGVSREATFASIKAATYRGLALAALAALVAFTAAWFTGRSLIRKPVERITSTVLTWRRGDASARTGMPAGAGEIENVGYAIDGFMEELTAQRASQRRAEGLSTQFLNSSRDCIVMLDLEGNTKSVSSGGIDSMEITDVEAIIGLSWLRVWKGEDGDAARTAVAEARSGGIGRFQGFCPTHKGKPKWWDVMITPLVAPDGTVEGLISVGRDITQQRRVEEQRNELTRELSHRMKNRLAMVQAIATQTFRQVKTVEEGRDAISGRLSALARAQDILTHQSWASAGIHEIVEGALAPHRTGEGRFEIAGPSVQLTAQQGLGLSLTLHELATNAAKYGALSNEVGRVRITWEVSFDGTLVFDWVESGGPKVEQPSQVGFGSRLVERIVAPYFDGIAKLNFEPQGVSFKLTGRVSDENMPAMKTGA